VWLSIKGRANEYHEHVWVLKHDRREREHTWEWLATVRSLSRWQKPDLGKILNWRALVTDSEYELVFWLLDYPVEPATHSIYSFQRRWPVNLGWRGGGRREGRVTGAA
jgi:hypothetical protein